MSSQFKISTIILIVIFSCITMQRLYNWSNPPLNTNNRLCLKKCVYLNPKAKKIILDSMHTKLEVNFIENSARNCFNPFFPIIHIKTHTSPNAWIHIVRTDSAQEYLKIFIENDTEFSPFYNRTDTFYNAPHWKYGIFNKPLSFWKGNAYAVKVDHTTKKITCLGGIKWGFRLRYFSLKPEMIQPLGLSRDDWKKDWQFFCKSVAGYTSETVE